MQCSLRNIVSTHFPCNPPDEATLSRTVVGHIRRSGLHTELYSWREQRRKGGGAMLNVRAGIIAGLAAATFLLPTEAWAQKVVVIRCETQSSGAISLTHWTRSNDAFDNNFSSFTECANSVAALLGDGYRLPFGLTTSASGVDRSHESLTFVFVKDLDSQIGSSGNSQFILPSTSKNSQLASVLPTKAAAVSTAQMPTATSTWSTARRRAAGLTSFLTAVPSGPRYPDGHRPKAASASGSQPRAPSAFSPPTPPSPPYKELISSE